MLTRANTRSRVTPPRTPAVRGGAPANSQAAERTQLAGQPAGQHLDRVLGATLELFEGPHQLGPLLPAGTRTWRAC